MVSPMVRRSNSDMPCDELVDVDRLHLQRMLAGIGEQPLHQSRGALRRLARGIEQAPHPLVAFGDAPQRKIDIAEDGGEEIVEVVRDAAGQPADRFHLLRLPQGALGQFAPRDFLHELRMRDRSARSVRRNATRLMPNNAIVAGIPNMQMARHIAQPVSTMVWRSSPIAT